jgi:predicted dehydrogenase
MITIGLVGCGAVVHTMYAKVLSGRPDYRVRYVCDIDASQATSAGALFGAEVTTLDGLARDADSIIISTPPSSHAGLVRACLREGRTVMCEKPYVTTHAEALELSQASAAGGCRLCVGQFRRTFPQVKLARSLVSMGLIGQVTGFAASEGGRFTWTAVSGYTTRDKCGGVLWDTGAHTLDMALFASGLDRVGEFAIEEVAVRRDTAEPSADFDGRFALRTTEGLVAGHVHVSRTEVLPNCVTVSGSRGSVSFVTELDDRVRLTTARGSTVLSAGEHYSDLLQCFDVELRRILLSEEADAFSADAFVCQIALLEALANA